MTDSFAIRGVISDDSSTSASDIRDQRFVRVTLEKISRMKPITGTTKANGLIESMLDESNFHLEADPKKYRLSIVKDDGDVELVSEEENLLSKITSLSSNFQHLLIQDAASVERESRGGNKMRAREFKRTQKLAGFFGVQKSESEVKVIRKALVSSATPLEAANVTNSLSQLKIIKAKGTAAPSKSESPIEDNGSLDFMNGSREMVKTSDVPDDERDAVKRAGKLAHFFGVKNNEKEVLTIRKLQKTATGKNAKGPVSQDEESSEFHFNHCTHLCRVRSSKRF